MATSTKPRCASVVWKKIIKTLHDCASSGTKRQGMRKSVWICAGAPTSTAPTGMIAGDFIYDTTNKEVYIYESGTTYTCVTNNA